MWTYFFNFKQYKTPAGSILQNLSGQTAWQHLSGPFFFCWDEKAPSYNWVYFLNPSYHPLFPLDANTQPEKRSVNDRFLFTTLHLLNCSPTHPPSTCHTKSWKFSVLPSKEPCAGIAFPAPRLPKRLTLMKLLQQQHVCEMENTLNNWADGCCWSSVLLKMGK